jgi:aminotransferase
MTRPRIDVFRPSCGAEELAAVAATFDSGWLGRGAKVAEFEAAWAAHIGVDPAHVVSVNSATEGLFQVCQGLGLLNGDEVIIPSIHFIGADHAIGDNGRPVYCDVDPHTLNPTLEHIAAAYHPGKTKALIILHYGGVAQELDTIRNWCDAHDIVMIEDAACAQATKYQGQAAGTFGHFGVWSFDAMKVMTCGDGGMIYCEDAGAARRLRRRIYLGLNEQSGLSSDQDRWWEYTVNLPARRSIMNDIAASIGLEQLKKLPDFVERRRQIVEQYETELIRVNIPFNVQRNQIQPYYFYWIQPHGRRRDELAKHLRSHNVYTTFRYYPLHRVFQTGQHLPGADYAADNTLLLPLHQGLTDGDVQFVCDKVKEFYGKRHKYAIGGFGKAQACRDAIVSHL